jgi:very-short-patch-repair endonuclease
MSMCMSCHIRSEMDALMRQSRRIKVMQQIVEVLAEDPKTIRAMADVIAGPRSVLQLTLLECVRLGMVVEVGRGRGGSVLYALPTVEPHHFDSPVEEMFWKAAREARMVGLHGLVPQVVVGKYRLDFAIADIQFGIEIDGMAYHNGQESFMRDRKRQRELEAQGWSIVRYAAKEVMEDAAACVRDAVDHAERVREQRERASANG